MTAVPENWIPFIPVHIENDVREIQLRRAALLRTIEGDTDPPERVEPRTQLLRQGLDLSVPVGYDLHEEEVPRAGVRVTQSFQRTRWYGGQVFIWLGARKENRPRRAFERTCLRSDRANPAKAAGRPVIANLADPVWRKPSLTDQITSIIAAYMKERGLPVPDGKVDLDQGLAAYGLDSLDGVAIVAELEDHFNLALGTNQAVRAKRLRDLVALVAREQEQLRRR